MEWYWYCTGIITVLFVQSVFLNYALVHGWIRISRERNRIQIVQAYDQDKSRELHRAN
jgi:hypothetical protein